jgi:hypothetical protein
MQKRALRGSFLVRWLFVAGKIEMVYIDAGAGTYISASDAPLNGTYDLSVGLSFFAADRGVPTSQDLA